MSEFLAMGGYAAYVWSAYGITLLVLAINVWSARKRHLDALHRARSYTRQERPRKRPTVRQAP